MDVETISLIDKLTEWGKEAVTILLGGGVAYWTHHVFHKIWHGSGRVPAFLRRLRRKKG